MASVNNKTMVIGDPHITLSNLLDSEKLIDFIAKIAQKENCTNLLFLGDLFHTHAVVRVEILDFWHKSFKKLNNFNIICLVGNHDKIHTKQYSKDLNALNVFKHMPHVTIVNEPMNIDGIAYVPYMETTDMFLEASKRLYDEGSVELLIAHQTFTGAQFENGFYAPEGIDPDLVYQDSIISGHIHKKQVIGKCFYPGTPKWDKASDANEEKGIFLYRDGLKSMVYEFISTEGVVTPIKKYTIKEGEELPELSKKHKNYIELIGKSAWIKKVKKSLKMKAQIKALPTDQRKMVVDKQKTASIYNYLENYFDTIDGVDIEKVKQYLIQELKLSI